MTKEQAFIILGLKSSATDREIKLKYANCAKRAKFDSSYDFDSASKAFDTIMGYSWGSFELDEAYSEKGLNKKKIESFFYLHIRAVIYSIVLVFIIIALLLSFFLTKVHTDYSLTVVGETVIGNQEEIQGYYEELLGVKEVLCSSYSIGDFDDQEVSLGGYWWLYQDLAGGDSHIFILSADTVKMLSPEGGLKDLMPYLKQLGILESDLNIVWWYDEEGNNLAAAYYFNESEILQRSYKGKIPNCFSIPFRADVDEMTLAVMNDLINNGQ